MSVSVCVCVCVCVCVLLVLWFTGDKICLMTWYDRGITIEGVYEDTAYVPVIQKA